MNLLIIGLAAFLITHLIPSFPKLKENLVGKLGQNGYKLLFSILSLASMVIIVFGLKQAEFVAVYKPPSWGRHIAMLLMLPAVYLFISSSVGAAPSSAKAVTAHPINWGVVFWSIAHLLANGDRAHVLLFITFLAFAIISIITGNMRGQKPKLKQRPPLKMEVIFILVVIIVYSLIVWGHQYITGMPLINL